MGGKASDIPSWPLSGDGGYPSPTMDQIIVFSTLLGALGLFLWGRWRHDLVAVFALMVLAFSGVISPERVFAGFGNEAVISVAAILMMGRAVEKSGLTEPLARMLEGVRGGVVGQNMALFGSTAMLSGIMNNTGTLAILMPLAIRLSREAHRVASKVLMPLAFASLLGGLLTVIGTPPNILVAQIRAEHTGEAFRMFDFTPVGLGLTVVGVVFLSLVGWRLLPTRRGAASTRGFYRIGEYFAEVVVPAGSRLVGQPLSSFSELGVEVNVVGLVRSRRRILAPAPEEILEAEDALLVEASGDELRKLIRKGELELGTDRRIAESELGAGEIVLQEVVLTLSSPLVGRSARSMGLRSRMGINVLAIHRLGERIVHRLRETRFRAGDVLLVQARDEDWDGDPAGPAPSTAEGTRSGCGLDAPCAQVRADLRGRGGRHRHRPASAGRGLHRCRAAHDPPRRDLLEGSLQRGGMAGDRAAGGHPAHRLGAGEQRRGREHRARPPLSLEFGAPPWVILASLLVVTMLISNLIDNAATAVNHGPIAYRIAMTWDTTPIPISWRWPRCVRPP